MLKERYRPNVYHIDHYNANRRKHSFANQVACHWNPLPTLFNSAPNTCNSNTVIVIAYSNSNTVIVILVIVILIVLVVVLYKLFEKSSGQ